MSVCVFSHSQSLWNLVSRNPLSFYRSQRISICSSLHRIRDKKIQIYQNNVSISMRKLLYSVTAPLDELPPAAVGNGLATFCQLIVLLPSPPRAEGMSSNNLSYLLGWQLFVDSQQCQMQLAVTQFYYCNKLLLIFKCLLFRSFKTVLRKKHLTKSFKPNQKLLETLRTIYSCKIIYVNFAALGSSEVIWLIQMLDAKQRVKQSSAFSRH